MGDAMMAFNRLRITREHGSLRGLGIGGDVAGHIVRHHPTGVVVQEDAFEEYMTNKELAEKTKEQRGYALKRIEKAHKIDLDDEYARDQMSSILKLFSYSAADDRAKRPNPTKMDIDADKLLSHLRWYKTHLADYARFKGGLPQNDAPSGSADDAEELTEDILEEAVGKTFALEKDLQRALRANLAQLEEGLRVEDGGSERRVEAGFIDILARDASGVLTVIELKSETARPEAVAQILAYMGCIAEETGQPVRGILVAGDHHPRVGYAARAIPNLTLKKYRYRFEFE